MYDDINPYRSLKTIDLLIKNEELDSKLVISNNIVNDVITESLYDMKEKMNEEIARRIYSGEINEETMFIFEDYMSRKHDIETEIMEQIDDVNIQAQYGDINDSELALKLEEIKHKKEEALQRLRNSIKE